MFPCAVVAVGRGNVRQSTFAASLVFSLRAGDLARGSWRRAGASRYAGADPHDPLVVNAKVSCGIGRRRLRRLVSPGGCSITQGAFTATARKPCCGSSKLAEARTSPQRLIVYLEGDVTID